MLLAAAVGVLVILLSSVEGARLGDAVSGTTMRQLLQAAGLLDVLNNGGPYTLFIPSDLYLNRYLSSAGISTTDLLQDTDTLKDFLLYHVVNGTITRDQLYNELKLTSLNGKTIRINSYSNRVLTAQGASLQPRDITASNGIIHYLYSPMEPANGTVAEIVASQSDLSTLLSAAGTTGTDEFFNDQNPITMFAPTNDAFNALGDKLQVLLGQPELLAEIIKYHAVPGTLYTHGMKESDLHTFEEADRLHLIAHLGSYLTIDGAHFMRNGVDLSASNGVVHKINKVLIPESLKSQI